MTSSIRSGSTPVRSSSEVRAKPRRSAGCQFASAPPRFPKVVRTTSTMTGSLMVLPPRLSVGPSGLGSGCFGLCCARGHRFLAAGHEVLHGGAGTGGRAFVGDAAVVQHDGPGGQLEHTVYLLLDHHQRGAVAIDLLQPLVDGVHHDGGETERQL